MKRFLIIYFLFILQSCQNNDLRKITPDEYLTLNIEKVRNNEVFVTDGLRIEDKDGNMVSEDSLNTYFNLDSIGFDRYVDNSGRLKLLIIRDKKAEDIEMNIKWDSLLTNDRLFLEKYLDLSGMDSIAKEEIKRAYSSKESPEKFSVDCSNICQYLKEALSADQLARQTGESLKTVDRRNQGLLRSIFDTCGEEAIQGCGKDGVYQAFMIVQHSPYKTQKEYFAVFERWTIDGFLEAKTFALLVDRVRISEGKKQLFGSQLRHYSSGLYELLPIEDPDRVGLRRDSVGLEPLDKYLKRFGIDSSGYQ